MSKFIKKDKRGFTLVETLVAISIFSVSILGLLSILSSGIANTNYAKQKIIGGYLAQEGIEYIRNMRDTYVLYDATDAATGWASFKTKLTSSGCAGANGCYFDPHTLNYSNPAQPMTGLTITACGGACPEMLYDSSTGTYGYVTGTTSGFTRKIQSTQISADEIKITSVISWAQGSGTYNITFSEDVFNWVE